MRPTTWALCLALSIPAGAAMTPGSAHADISSRCDGLTRDWNTAIGPRGNKRDIPRLRDEIEQKGSSCPDLRRRASTYRTPVSEPIKRTPTSPPPPQEAKLEACLADIVKQATTLADQAYAVEQKARVAAQQGEQRAREEHQAHPDRASAPAEGKWTYPDGHTLTYWGDTIANNTPNGYGVMESSDGNRSSGMFQNGSANALGIYKYKGGAMIASFRNGIATGPGVLDYGDTKHARIIEDGPNNKYVVVTFKDKSVFKGRTPDANAESAGVMYDRDAKVANAGIFKSYTYFSRPITKSDCSG